MAAQGEAFVWFTKYGFLKYHWFSVQTCYVEYLRIRPNKNYHKEQISKTLFFLTFLSGKSTSSKNKRCKCKTL